MPKRVRDMEFDEVSTVDRPANQHGLIVLAKRANQEESVSGLFDAEGYEVDPDLLELGDTVFTAEGEQVEIVEAGTPGSVDFDDELTELLDDELEGVGKALHAKVPAKGRHVPMGQGHVQGANTARASASAFGASRGRMAASRLLNHSPVSAAGTKRGARKVGAGAQTASDYTRAYGSVAREAGGNTLRRHPVATSLAAGSAAGYGASQVNKAADVLDELRDELSKAVSGEDREALLLEAVSELAKSADSNQSRVDQLFTLAKSEHDLRLEREYVEIAKGYTVPVRPEVLGPVLMHIAEALPYEEQEVIVKALSAAGASYLEEHGYDGLAGNEDDPMAEVDAFIAERVGAIRKAAPAAQAPSREELTKAYFDANPGAYDAYRSRRAV